MSTIVDIVENFYLKIFKNWARVLSWRYASYSRGIFMTYKSLKSWS